MLVSSTQTENKQSLTKKELVGIKPTPELMAILLVYFVQGILGLASLAVSFFLKDDLGLSPAQASALMGIAALPWVVKPLFGFMSDGLPILGYRRRPYLVLSGLLGATAWVSMATVVHNPWGATLAIALSAFSMAVSDVIVDSLVVERSRDESFSNAGTLQSLCWGSSAFGGLITAYFSGFLLENFSNRTVFSITATFPLLVSVIAWLISEQRVNLLLDTSTVRKQVQELRKAVSQKSIWMPTVFVFLWLSAPSSSSALFFFTTNELGFEPEFLGRIRLVTSMASLAGIWLFQRFFKTVPFRKIFAWTAILTSLLGMTQLLLVTHTNRALGIDDHWFSLGDSVLLSAMGQIAYMPILVLAARLCPPGVEATLFALLMSTMNFSSLVSLELGAGLMNWLGITDINFNSLWILVLVANLSRLLLLPFLNLLPGGDPQIEIQQLALENAVGLEVDRPAGESLLPDLIAELVPQSPESSTS